MKTLFSDLLRLLTLLLLASWAVGPQSSAQAAELSYTTRNGTLTVKGECPGTAGAVIIPPVINGLPVTSIGWRAFAWCAGLTNIAIPDSVTSVGDAAFRSCTGLTSVTIGNGVTNIWHITHGPRVRVRTAFIECSSLTAISVGALNPVYSSLDGVLFDKAQTTLTLFPMGKAGSYSAVSRIGNPQTRPPTAHRRCARRAQRLKRPNLF